MPMKVCVWCRKGEGVESFKKKAHTLPDSLGGMHKCDNVCDRCNAFFGSPQVGLMPIETALKEGLNLSKFHLLSSMDSLKKGDSAGRFKSVYFKADFKSTKHSVRLKPPYSLRPHFQELITRQFKRGLYKVFLEEIERQRGKALEDRFDFIREFARYNLNDLPVLHFERIYGALFCSIDDLRHPQLFMEEESRSKYLLEECGFFEFDLLGHVFALATSKLWHINFDQYIRKSLKAKATLFHSYKVVKSFDDLDLTLKAFSN